MIPILCRPLSNELLSLGIDTSRSKRDFFVILTLPKKRLMKESFALILKMGLACDPLKPAKGNGDHSLTHSSPRPRPTRHQRLHFSSLPFWPHPYICMYVCIFSLLLLTTHKEDIYLFSLLATPTKKINSFSHKIKGMVVVWENLSLWCLMVFFI